MRRQRYRKGMECRNDYNQDGGLVIEGRQNIKVKQSNIIINMTSQQIKQQNIQNPLYIRTSMTFPQSNPIVLASSPKTQRNDNPPFLLESTFNCFSPKVKNQISNVSFYASPQRCATTREIKLQTFTSVRYIDKGRRVTLPLQKLDLMDTSSKYLPSEPIRQQKTQIKFIYHNNLQTSRVSNLKPSNKNSQVLVFKQNKQEDIPKQKMMEYKISKNKICSKVFSFFYEPLSSIRKKSQQLQHLLKSLKKQANLLSSRVITSSDSSKQCKTSATETNTSAMYGINVSEMSSDSSRWSQSTSKCNFQTGYNINICRPSLADRIPSSKQLGKTIILNNSTTYDFGGLMLTNRQSIQESRVQINPVGQSIPREWDQLKGLLVENTEQNMKKSIHCSPDVRANSFNCQMLQNFGRVIKESTIDYHE